jgi:hypothetical protein
MSTTAPSFATLPPATHATRRGEWSIALLFSLLLVMQLAWQSREQLAATPVLRQPLESLCHLFACKLPAWHEPTALTLISRDVIALPEQPGVLRVQASFRNDARWAQRWPILVLSLSDANGYTIGRRRFTPEHYLGNTPEQALLAANQATQIAFDIVDPSPGVVAFDFRFE